MAKIKLPARPSKPKASASIATKENYIKRHAEWKKECNRRLALKKKDADLTKRISGLK